MAPALWVRWNLAFASTSVLASSGLSLPLNLLYYHQALVRPRKNDLTLGRAMCLPIMDLGCKKWLWLFRLSFCNVFRVPLINIYCSRGYKTLLKSSTIFNELIPHHSLFLNSFTISSSFLLFLTYTYKYNYQAHVIDFPRSYNNLHNLSVSVEQ